MGRVSGTTLRLAALLLLAIPAGLLGRLLVDNVATGDSRTLGHVVIEVPLVLAMAALWRWPRTAGGILVAAALAAMVVNPLTHLSRPWQEFLLVDALIFAPPLLAGVLLRVGMREPRA